MDYYTVDDIEASVREWYAAKGLSVPPAEKPWLRAFREEAATNAGKLWTSPLPDAPQSAVSDKLVYGTPAFWKNFWAKKHEKKKALGEAKEAEALAATMGSMKLTP